MKEKIEEMPRYINIDDAIRVALQKCIDVVGHGITQVDAANIAFAFEEIPTADVVPKSEYEKKKLEIWRLQGEFERLQAEKEMLELGVKDLRFRNKELQKANEGFAKYHDDLELQLEEAIEFRRNQVKRIFAEIEEICVGMQDYTEYAKLKNKYTEG